MSQCWFPLRKRLHYCGLDRKVQKSLPGLLNPKWIKLPRVFCKRVFSAYFGCWSSVHLLKTSEEKLSLIWEDRDRSENFFPPLLFDVTEAFWLFSRQLKARCKNGCLCMECLFSQSSLPWSLRAAIAVRQALTLSTMLTLKGLGKVP